MDYKEKYEQGLECIQEILSSGQEKIKITLLKERLLPFFPELESEDDKIRKGLIKALSSVGKRNWGGIDVFKSIAWLEKQKEIDKEIVFRPLAGIDIIAAAKQALEKIEIGKEVVLAFNGAYIHVNGKTVAEICNEYFAWTENRVKHLENYDEAEKEKADFVGDGFIECRADFLDFKEGNSYWLEYVGDDKYNVRSDNLLGKTYHITPCQLYTIFKKLTWLEKQGEQKPVDMIEPKFKVGDWVIRSIKNEKRIGIVTEILPEHYIINFDGWREQIPIIYGDCIDIRLWTIQDAKDGDVLVCNEEILLFKSYSVQGRISLYCWYNGQTNNFHSKDVTDALLTTRNKICPATKEQRDTLMKAMADAGYTFDFEKKELKRIEQNMELTDFESALFTAFSDAWQQYLRGEEVNVAQWAKEHSAELLEEARKEHIEWSEEDENILEDTKEAVINTWCGDTQDIILDWLESLKQRIGG